MDWDEVRLGANGDSIQTGQFVFKLGGLRLQVVPRHGVRLEVKIDPDGLTILNGPLTLTLSRIDGMHQQNTLSMQATQCRITQGDSLIVELNGDVRLSASQHFLRAKADSLLLTIPPSHVSVAGEQKSGIPLLGDLPSLGQLFKLPSREFECQLKNVSMTVKMGQAKDSSLLSAEKISVVFKTNTLALDGINASKVVSLRVSNFKRVDDARRQPSLQQLVSPTFKDATLGEVIDWVRDSCGINIVIDRTALEEEGVYTTTPVTLRVKDVQLSSMLKFILQPLHLGVQVDEPSGVVVVTSQIQMQGKMAVAAYPVADLLIAFRRSGVVSVSIGGDLASGSDVDASSDGV